MRLAHLRIENFRNLDGIDIPLAGSPVVVGENRAGKSNLVHAIRLLLDPGLSNAARRLRAEDFSAHLGEDPMGAGAEIKVCLEVEDFDTPPLMATLRHAIVGGDPVRARLTYRFGPPELEEGEEDLSSEAYVWSIYGGDDEAPRRIPAELRSYLHHEHLGALRDVQGDMASFRRSPLRSLLEQAARDADEDSLEAVRDALKAANLAVAGLDPVKELSTAIATETARLVGQLHALDPVLTLAPGDPERSVRDLRLLLDGDAQRSLGSGSLGSLNVLYLALLELELARRVQEGEIVHALISIEEPEAHLHPHLQRRVFRTLQESDGPERSTLVTTHSTHIVSATDPRKLIFLRAGENASQAFAASEADLTDRTWADISRYLDVTRSEMVFARRVVLVEGFAEQLLLPLMAKHKALDLDGEGVSICAVGGVHFEAYVRFLRAIGTPYVVVTDGDPKGPKGRTGSARVERIARRVGGSDAHPEEQGLFHGDETLEADVFTAHGENARAIFAALDHFNWTQPREAELREAIDSGEFSTERLMVFIDAVAKGRFAQRLAGDEEAIVPPAYIEKALAHVMAQ